MNRTPTNDERNVQRSLDFVNEQIRNLTATKTNLQKSIDEFITKRTALENQLVTIRQQAGQTPV